MHLGVSLQCFRGAACGFICHTDMTSIVFAARLLSGGIWFMPFAAEHDIFGEVSSSDDEVNILDSGDEVSGPAGFRPDDVKDSLDLGFAEAAATLDPDVCESLFMWFCLCGRDVMIFISRMLLVFIY